MTLSRQFWKRGIKRAVLVAFIVSCISGLFLVILFIGENPYFEERYEVAVLLAVMLACIFFVVAHLCYFAVLWCYFVVRWIIKGFRAENKQNSAKV
jgi:hypothetical protein